LEGGLPDDLIPALEDRALLPELALHGLNVFLDLVHLFILIVLDLLLDPIDIWLEEGEGFAFADLEEGAFEFFVLLRDAFSELGLKLLDFLSHCLPLELPHTSLPHPLMRHTQNVLFALVLGRFQVDLHLVLVGVDALRDRTLALVLAHVRPRILDVRQRPRVDRLRV